MDDSEKSVNAACAKCHGDPPGSHLGRINCTACHADHQASVAYCAYCHVFKDMQISHNSGATPKSTREDLSGYAKADPKKVESTDILIVGSGATGFSAALEAAGSGAKITILEKMPVLGGNSQLAAGGMNAAPTPFQEKRGIKDSAEAMYIDTMKGGKNMGNPELVRILADRSAESLQWLDDRGAVLDNPGLGGGASAPRMHSPSGGAFTGRYLREFFRKQIQGKKIDLRLNSKVVRLVTDSSGAVTGAIVRRKHSGLYRMNAKAVILATGGFGANPDMIARYRPEIRDTATSNQPGTQGDGIVMGEAIGAATVDMKEIRLNPTLPAGSPVIVSEIVRGAGGVFVNRDGVRFISELTTRDVTSAAILEQKGGTAFIVFDQRVRDTVKQTEAAFNLKKAYEGDTIGGLHGANRLGGNSVSETITFGRIAGRSAARFVTGR